MTNRIIFLAFLFVLMMPFRFGLAQSNDLDSLKAEAVSSIDSLAKLNQEIIDSLFSFAELGFQEFETQRYLTEILEQNYFDDVQTAEERYRPFISPDDPPAIDKNQDIMAKFKPMLEELYYDPDRLETYLDQPGIDYPQLTPTEIRRN